MVARLTTGWSFTIHCEIPWHFIEYS